MAYFNRNKRQDNRRSFDDGARRDFGGRGEQRQDRRMYPAVCDECGRDCQVPFRPDGSKPVYCSECFEKKQGRFERKRDNYGGRQFNNRKDGQRQNLNNEVLASINSKLGQILELMRNENKPSQKTVVSKPKKKVKKKKIKRIKKIKR